jgi:competence protein ComEA
MKKIASAALALIVTAAFGTLVFASDALVKRIDINTATEAQLKTIPGIGDDYAKKIVAARPYTKKDQLKTKNIIPADTYEKIEKLIDSVC